MMCGLVLCTVANMTNGIYANLIKVNHIANPPKLIIIKSDRPDAWYFRNRHVIKITTALANTADKNSIGWTLGHELVHAKYRHKVSNWTAINKWQEQVADIEGSKMAEKAGYDHCLGFKWLYDGKLGDADHPNYKTRARYLGCKYEHKYEHK